MSFTSLENGALTGFDPVHGQEKSRNLSAAALIPNGGGWGIAHGGPRGALRRVRALRAALANAFAFTQLRALTGFDPVRGQQKKPQPLGCSFNLKWWRLGGSNP